MKYALIALCCLSVGCSIHMEHLMNQHYSIAIDEYGPPTNRSEDGRGGMVLEWRIWREGYHDYFNNIHTAGYYAMRRVWVDEKGIIYGYSGQGM